MRNDGSDGISRENALTCQWPHLNKGAECTNGCGQKPLARDYVVAPARQCKKVRQPCTRRGDEMRIELIRCETCQGNVRKKFPVHACEVFGECLPTYQGEAENVPHKCRGCESYLAG